MSAASFTSLTTSSPESAVTPSRASVLVQRVRSLSNEQVAQELRERRGMTHEERMQRATSGRKERARLAAARLRNL